MVRFCWLLLVPALLMAEAQISVAVHSERVSEYAPIDALVTVAHDRGERIDETSFEIQGKSVPARFVQSGIQASFTFVNGARSEKCILHSQYIVELPGRPSGRHLLSPISVLVGSERVVSPSTTYVVYGAESSPDFRLEAAIEGGDRLYPGQRCTLVYRLIFADPIDATLEDLPLFESSAFRKIGDPQIVYEYRGGLTVQEIRQEVRAVQVGDYHIPSSVIEGFPYAKDFFGKRLYGEKRMRAESEPLDLFVLPFPEEGRESHFDGAIGNVVVKARLLSSSSPRVGDKMRIRIDLVGKGEWPTIHSPNLSKQPAFSEQFRLSDLPSAGEEGVGRKSFTVELRPLSEEVTEIPALEYALFDPATGRYRMARSRPIPIRVEPSPALEIEEEEIALAPEPEEEVRPSYDLLPVEEAALEISRPSNWLWFAFPLVALILGLQGLGSRALQRDRRPETPTCLLRRAREAGDSGRKWHWMERALTLYLAGEEPRGEALRLWEEIAASRYAPIPGEASDQLLCDLESLFEEGP